MKNLIRAVAGMLALTVAMEAGAQSCTGDIVADGKVDGGDLGVLLSNWGPVVPTSPASVASDIDGNGQINGADLGLLLSNWGYCPVTISGISPNQGCVAGGTEITITGTWLGQASAVKVGGVACTGVTPISATTLKATTPAGQLGPAAVSVTTPAGTWTASQTFTYMPASVSSIVPNQGLAAGGTLITITGQYLGLSTGVTIGGVPTTNVTVVNANTLTAVTPSGSVGPADVVITGGKGELTVTDGFHYVSQPIVPAWADLVQSLPDPAAVTDPGLRARIVASELAWKVRHRTSGIEMVLVPSGSFIMGSTAADPEAMLNHEAPAHQVTISRAFYLGVCEVTQSQWTAMMGNNPSYFQGPAYPNAANRPVETVSWVMTQGFLASTGLRLPTEAEWEYACRAGTAGPRYGSLNEVAWWGGGAWNEQSFGGNSGGETHVVGTRGANALGLHDMLGNVCEWVRERYSDYNSLPAIDPQGPDSGTVQIIRGGSWWSNSGYTRAAVRSTFYFPFDSYPTTESNQYGFRVARNP
jgi:formylglycine-generating enzyme required for sulfatase activity